MTDRDKQIEQLLVAAKKSVSEDMQRSKFYGDRFGVCLNTYEGAINQALALLRKPTCEKCGGSGQVGVPAEVSNYGTPIGKDADPCPDCKEADG